MTREQYEREQKFRKLVETTKAIERVRRGKLTHDKALELQQLLRDRAELQATMRPALVYIT